MEAQQWMPLQRLLVVSHTHFSIQWYLLAVNTRRAMPLISFVHMHATIAIDSLHSATPINLLLSQEFYPCNVPRNIKVQQTYSLHFHLYKPRFCVCSIAAPTNSSRYLFVYREYTLLGTCNTSLTQFLSMLHSLPIQVTSRSDPDCYPGQQLWPSFNADPYSTTTV